MGTIFIGKSIITYTLTDELEKQQSKLNVRKEGERERINSHLLRLILMTNPTTTHFVST